MVIAKKLHVNFGINHLQQVVNIVEKQLAKSVKSLK